MSTRDRFGRRQLLGALALGTLAGCLDSTDSSDNDEDDLEPEPVSVDPEAPWRTTTLEDATGESITPASSDNPVLLHTFSTGCAACQSQHREFDAVSGSATIVDLSIDPNEGDERLRDYAEDEGYDWHFAVASEDVTQSLIEEFGQEVTSSATSPVIVDCGDESVYRLEKVIDSEDLEGVLADRCG